MWLFSKHGFFSAVQYCGRPDTIHLRARFKGDLERLFKANGVRAQIHFTAGNDYAYRANVKKSTWVKICAREASEIDYPNFKNAVHDGTERDAAYMGVWSVMRRSQENALCGQNRLYAPNDRLNEFMLGDTKVVMPK